MVECDAIKPTIVSEVVHHDIVSLLADLHHDHTLTNHQSGVETRVVDLFAFPSRMSLVQLLLVLCAVSLHLSAAWILPPTTSALARPPSTKLFVVETISLENMTNHEEDGSLLAESIARWLDHEVRLW